MVKEFNLSNEIIEYHNADYPCLDIKDVKRFIRLLKARIEELEIPFPEAGETLAIIENLAGKDLI